MTQKYSTGEAPKTKSLVSALLRANVLSNCSGRPCTELIHLAVTVRNLPDRLPPALRVWSLPADHGDGESASGVMAELRAPGVRRLPTVADVDAVLAGGDRGLY